MESNSISPSQSNTIPDSFAVFIHDGNRYLVPNFIWDAMQQSLHSNQMRRDLDVDKMPGGSPNGTELGYDMLARDEVMIPADPPLTKRELLGLHAEVKALQKRLGISYKDASHRLYMAEVERLQAEQRIHRISATVKGETQKALQLFKKDGSDADADADGTEG
ncbi:hypothetical protein JOM56_012979 [Amanita muscaria]